MKCKPENKDSTDNPKKINICDYSMLPKDLIKHMEILAYFFMNNRQLKI